jgi:anaerobic magnesium-protoporphyrin IX monomethyl ester cyclase
MRTVLYTIPTYFFEQPQGVPRLLPYLKSRDHEVEQVNLNYLVFREALGQDFLGGRLEACRDQPGLRAALAGQDPGAAAARVAAASDELDRRFGTLSAERFIRLVQQLRHGLELLAATYEGARLCLDTGLSLRWSPFSSGDIAAAAEDGGGNPLVDLYERLIPAMSSGPAPDVAGISIAHNNQIIPGFTLAHLLRQRGVGKVVLGGPAASQLASRLPGADALAHLFDMVVLGPGEQALHSLLLALGGSGELERSPNLMYRVRPGGLLRRGEVTEELVLEQTYTPEYEEPRPRPIIAVEGSLGCYWGRCAFCDRTIDGRLGGEARVCYHEKPLAQLTDEVAALAARHRPLFIRLTDSAVPPARLLALAEGLKARGAGARLFAYVRAERDFASARTCRRLARAGVVALSMGLESGCQRHNDRQDKGIKVKQTGEVLKRLHRAGVINVAFAMVGFPGETVTELCMTEVFLRRHRRHIDALLMSRFTLLANSRAFADPARYGIRDVRAPDGHDLPYYYLYTPETGPGPGVERVTDALLRLHKVTKDSLIIEVLKKVG